MLFLKFSNLRLWVLIVYSLKLALIEAASINPEDEEFLSSFEKKSTITTDISTKEKIKKKKNKKKKLPQPKHYFLERYDDENLLAQYTNTITIGGHSFELNRESAVTRNQAVVELLPLDRCHIVARGICYHDTGIRKTDIKTSLGFSEINITPDVTIDWVSQGDSPENNGYYSRVSPGGAGTSLFGGHSESYFIRDIKALWTQNYTSVLKFLLPSPVFHREQDVYMTGIELFGSRDTCSHHIPGQNNRYDCVRQLVNFRHEHEEGQQSISQAVRDLLKDRFKGGANSRGFVLIYHASAPYGNADYKAVDGDRSFALSWGNNRFNSPAGDRPATNDILQQYGEVEEEPNRLYCYIHGLADRQLTYNAAGYFQY
jgi:hypothetical protein